MFGEPGLVKLADGGCFTFVFVCMFDLAFVYVSMCL